MADSEKKTKKKKSSSSSSGDAAPSAGGVEAGAAGSGGEGPKSILKQPSEADRLKGDVITFYQPPPVPEREEDVLQEIDDKKLRELKEAFFLLDLNNDGLIDKEDLRMTYSSLGRPDIPERDLEHMLGEAMYNPLDFDAFVILLGYRTVELDPEETLLDALASWDSDDSGLINEEHIKHDLMTWGDKFTEKEVEMALEDAPIYARGENVYIDYVEFCKKLCGLRKKK
ncbi:myosin regulatory light chain, smooth muscle [Ischnura elegans]|uniref:myosin regulatory light chain, smooth muscle n=1 Tax=Ischnura elegans TaxID=197161 RepID=UPI001ED8BE5F|nr:myosin regulatory light chain, smooth muscle [Ischnura elegans]